MAVLRGAVLACAALLTGCSALQIDVDVYKGPLSNEREIQLRQYAALARSAKPVLVMLRKDLDKAEQTLEVTKALTQIHDLLDFYDQTDNAKKAQRENKSGQPLKKNEIAGCAADGKYLPVGEEGKRWIALGQSAKGIDGLHDSFLETLAANNFDDSACPVRVATQHLTEALIVFSERMLFVVNNSQLFSTDYDAARTLLQTLGNTLIIHANDLRRQQLREDRQDQAFKRELKATAVANDVRAPALVVPDVLRALDTAAVLAKTQAVANSKAVQSARDTAAQRAAASARAQLDKAQADAAAKRWDQEPLRAAALTLLDPQTNPKFAPPPPASASPDLAAAKKDKQAIEALFTATTAPAQLNGEGFRDQVVGWIRSQDLAPEISSERLQRLRLLKRFLDAGGLAFASIASAKPVDLLVTIRQQLDQRRVDAEKDWERVQQQQLSANTSAEQAASASTAAEATLAASTQMAETSAPVKAALDAKAAAAALTDTLLKQAASTGLDSPEAVRGAWLAALEGSRAGKDEATNAVITAAISTVRAATLSPGFAFTEADYGKQSTTTDKAGKTTLNVSQAPSSKTAMAVLDDVISLLRNRRIRALADGKQPEADNLQKAIDAAYDHRTSQIYIRPAADYLKNVYSATALQDDNVSPNRNMLVDYLRRLGSDGKLPEARRQLEKVFWQNINRVSVSGGGATNYVLAKDDVGNWYVKAYGSDTTQIFNSARSLFLFNSGRKLDVNLLERADLRRRASDRALTPEERKSAQDSLDSKGDHPAPPALDFASRSKDRFLGIYVAEAERHAFELAAAYEGWPAALKAAWAAELKGVDKADAALAELQAKATELHTSIVTKAALALAAVVDAKSSAAKDAARANRLSSELGDALDAGRRFRQQLVKAHADLKLEGVPEPIKAKLLATTRTVLRETLAGAVDKRQKSANAYADSLTTLGDMVSAK